MIGNSRQHRWLDYRDPVKRSYIVCDLFIKELRY